MNFPDFLSNRRKTETLVNRYQPQNSKSQAKLTIKPGLFGKSKGSQPVIEIYKEAKGRGIDFKSPKAILRKETRSKDNEEPGNVYRKGSFVASSGFFKKQKSQSRIPIEIFNQPKITASKLKDLCSLDRVGKKNHSKVQLGDHIETTKDRILNNKKNSKNVLKGKFFSTMNIDGPKKGTVVKQKRLNLDRSPKTTECTKTLSFSKKKQHTLNVNSLVESFHNQPTIKDYGLVNPLLRAKLKNLEIRLLSTLTAQKRGLGQ